MKCDWLPFHGASVSGTDDEDETQTKEKRIFLQFFTILYVHISVFSSRLLLVKYVYVTVHIRMDMFMCVFPNEHF